MEADTPTTGSLGHGNGAAEVWADGETLLTVNEVAAILKVPAGWVYEHCRPRVRNRLPGFKLGKYWRFRAAEVLGWLEKRAAGQYR
jgi:excisionase family DNA binding protein